jgi:hypothetical protein
MTESERKPILLVDFDGVIHSYVSGWQGPDVATDPPVPGAAGFLHGANKHFEVNIYSSRSRQLGGIACMRLYLTHRVGLSTKDVAQLRFPTQKPAAFLTIDDRCIQFEGEFPDPLSLLEFKPWNKKDEDPKDSV